MRPARLTTAIVAAGTLALAACGGSPDGGSATDGQEATPPENAGTESAPTPAADLSPEQVRQAVADRITEGADSITVTDPTTGEKVRLAYDHVHENVKTSEGGRRFVCVDFRGPDGTVHDVDYYLDVEDGDPAVEDRILHKVGDENVVPDSIRRRLDRKL